jgi:DNA-binding response OmpR family regulator
MSKNILIVDDDLSIAEILEFNLKSEGYDVETAVSAEEALSKNLKKFHLILLDVMWVECLDLKWQKKCEKMAFQHQLYF